MTQAWTRVGRRADFEDGFTHVPVGRTAVVVGAVGGDIVAFSAFCPHMQGPMKYAEVEGKVVTCPLHGWRFDLAHGGREIHNYRDLETYPVRIDGQDVFVAI